jgi:hypothetical protein
LGADKLCRLPLSEPTFTRHLLASLEFVLPPGAVAAVAGSHTPDIFPAAALQVARTLCLCHHSRSRSKINKYARKPEPVRALATNAVAGIRSSASFV